MHGGLWASLHIAGYAHPTLLLTLPVVFTVVYTTVCTGLCMGNGGLHRVLGLVGRLNKVLRGNVPLWGSVNCRLNLGLFLRVRTWLGGYIKTVVGTSPP
jgi:hypothetical protein